jgi:hypothetical protein
MAAALIVLAGCSSGDDPVQLLCTSFPDDLDTYWAGPSFDGLDLTYATTRCGTPDPDGVPDPVSFSYGVCTPQRGTPCGPPIDILNRSKEGSRKPALPGTDITVSGVPATRYEGGRRLQIYYPDVTVEIYADDAALADRFANALKKAPRGSAELAAQGLEFEFDRPADRGWGRLLMLAVGLFLVSLAVGRWWLVILPVVGLTVLYAGIYNGWWGNGFGDGWQVGFLMALFIGVGVVAAGVLLNRPVRARFARP